MTTARTVIVIGAGFGGLAAAIRLASRGHRVTLLERQQQLGGRGMVFRQDGYTFDAGPTVITAPFLLEELFALSGRSMSDYVQLVPVDPWYRVLFPDGRSFDYVGDEERTLEQIRAFEPRDVDGWRRMRAHSEDIYKVGFEQLADVPFSSLSTMLKAVPQMVRLRSDRSVFRAVSRFIRDDALRQVFTFQPLLVGGNPFRTSSIYMLIGALERRFGVHFPLGGTGALVAALGKLCVELGVEVRLGETVEEIEVQAGRVQGVRLAGGARLRAERVVCNADAPAVYERLIAPAHRRVHTASRLRRLKYSMGLFVAYFGTSRTHPGLAHHTILLGPRYRELLSDIFDAHKLADDFSLYLHAPTRTDPALAPAGHEGFYVLSPVPNNQGRPVDWEREATRYRDRIFESLEKRAIPGLRADLTTAKVITPDHFERELLSMHGAGFSIEPTLRQSAYLRFHNESEDVRGLYFVGAGTHPGAGVPGVLCSAKVLDRLIPAVSAGAAA
ncbi:MAG: phytoene desaturase [Deltaproteobacteria bacterium]|nr:phytoene desaturase [Deltaproteobacteria bacterium]